MNKKKLPVLAVSGINRHNLGTFLACRFSDSSMIWGQRSLRTFFNDRTRRAEDKELDVKIGMKLMSDHASQQVTLAQIRKVINTSGILPQDTCILPSLQTLSGAMRDGYKPGGFLLDWLTVQEKRERIPAEDRDDNSEAEWNRLTQRNAEAEQHPLPSIRLIKTHEPSLSKLGGLPNLPDSVQWPKNPQGTELTLLAQIHCPELPQGYGLPETGTIFFFYDFEEKESFGYNNFCKVIYTTAPLAEVVRQRSTSANCMNNALWLNYDEKALPETIDSCFAEVFVKFETFESHVTDSDNDTFAQYRMLGYPQWCQQEFMWQEHETLLLQLASDKEEYSPHWIWADCGKIYFWLKSKDLVAKKFNNVEMSMDF